ncbi:bifunctional 5,10-methylenetetrahydrofolate dehydrogenase/5,10-methenyltetrahydrofolate cyclohydrolase [Thermosyntropha sp.]|uniref:bifunctional 5,10-methylenetetrahydrofolate dehydrogenase/5,10-methenyltetrahydrofolate cyclohydrolase n=1 Tax=Thermosyntropha sp. TaxID=2740820 RepID=UPI0025EBB4DA|nr:bifunctional 5,10-methylenetetrahydrofolate dehydrogenase/5,10-methenyltetrahydrofolate cyclohydrolase [Thermosyntropha sp.]MBO8159194.1 bifunctional 5,10-methylenetetrahydrofolate dehydrogenase/5,10-methenyltetrahydrofolate cyclohydrolase [Thermosyntropha sp.]
MQIIDGLGIAREIRERIKAENLENNIKPRLAVVVVGDDKESLVYVGLKEKAVEYTGGEVEHVIFPSNVTRDELVNRIKELNEDSSIDGILLQLPLPEDLNPFLEEILSAISPHKDVDGFTPHNRGLLMGEKPSFTSCAALAALEVIERNIISLQGKKATLIGDSFDLILPLSVMLVRKGVNVDVIPELDKRELEASDIFVFEKGDPLSVTGEMINEGALVIDAGFHWLSYDKICGNVHNENLKEKDGFLLPVPGGLGPILISKLLQNLQLAYRRNRLNNA